MLAEEYMLVDISLSAASCCDLSSQHQLKFIQLIILFIFSYRADESRNISTAESPDRCVQFFFSGMKIISRAIKGLEFRKFKAFKAIVNFCASYNFISKSF